VRSRWRQRSDQAAAGWEDAGAAGVYGAEEGEGEAAGHGPDGEVRRH